MIAGAYLISITLMIVLPVILAVWLRRVVRVPWFLFTFGMLTFAVSQFVHFPLNNWLADIGILAGRGDVSTIPLWQKALVLGLTAGVCEELARYAGFWILRKHKNPSAGIMLGLGHGGIESMIFGGLLTAATVSSIFPLVGKDLSLMDVSPEQIAVIETQMKMVLSSPWNAFLPLLERLVAISIHVVFTLIVLQAFQERQPLYVVVAILYHALVDASAVYVVEVTKSVPLTFLTLVLACVPGWLWLVWFWRRQPGLVPSRKPEKITQELRIFAVAVRKEFLQQWRTRRVLGVLAVFLVFGLMSPLLAYFLPEMMSAIPGAEQFAGLIPDPTQADAFIQYIKNISQFGFLLALLIGIGDVAGEKERGTASMVLSKPLTRWAFISSKYFAQFVVFAVGLLLAGMGGAFYTVVLFEPADIPWVVCQYGWISFLLFAWLLTYLAVGLVGSTLASTVTTAAGFSIVGAMVLVLLGNIPQISGLMPGALIGWASQIGAAAELPPVNGGALAAAAIISLIGLIASIALFEQQEL